MITHQIFNMVDAGIITLNKDLKITDCNNWVDFRSSIKRSEILNRNIIEVFPNLDNEWFRANCRSVQKFGNYAFFSQKLHEYCIPLKVTGKYRREFKYMQQNCTLAPIKDEKRKITGFFLMINDVTDIIHYENSLRKMAHTDGLTGIYNRSFFDKRLLEEFDRHKRYSRSMCIIMFDLDNFKKVNDTQGHQYGDFVLKKLAFLVKGRIRDIDIFARYGGEEFILILPETDFEKGLIVAESLRKIIKDHEFIFREKSLPITISLGISTIKKETENSETLVKEADDALYISKKNGKNIVSTIESECKKP